MDDKQKLLANVIIGKASESLLAYDQLLAYSKDKNYNPDLYDEREILEETVKQLIYNLG